MGNFKLIRLFIIVSLILGSIKASANNISATTAHAIANNFIKQHAQISPGSIKAPATADIKLAHAEPSSKSIGSNVYYIFNIQGGGFIIVAGEDRATHVLGYSDKGHIDINQLSEPLLDLLACYKNEIEYLQTHTNPQKPCVNKRGFSSSLEPLIKTTWGPDEPFNLHCPIFQNTYSKVGCVGVCMAQILYFWRYPSSCGSYEAYYDTKTRDTIPAIPATTFDYSKMLLSYCHWDWNNAVLVQDKYTDEQAQEVAKLCRYTSQAAKTDYSPTGSSATEGNKLKAMKSLGYNPKAKSVYSVNYDIDEWEQMMLTELNAYRPIMFAAKPLDNVGHAFIVDGYNEEGYFHMNMGWFGTNDGWYLTTAVSFINRYDVPIDYSYGQKMITGIEPPLYCNISASDIDANQNLLILGNSFSPKACCVYLNSSYRTIDLMFTLNNADGDIVAQSETIQVQRHLFEQGCDISSAITLPTTLAQGMYDVQFRYSTQDIPPTAVCTAKGKLLVVGKFAKFNGNFDVLDVTKTIDFILNSTPTNVILDVTDLTMLINYILTSS